MTPVDFEGSNIVYAKNQPEYLPLPAHYSDFSGRATTCWQLTWRERFQVLFTGQFWLQQLTFGNKFQPQKPMVKRPELWEAE